MLVAICSCQDKFSIRKIPRIKRSIDLSVFEQYLISLFGPPSVLVVQYLYKPACERFSFETVIFNSLTGPAHCTNLKMMPFF